MYKTVFVKAYLKQEVREQVSNVQVGTRTISKRKGLFDTAMVQEEEPVYEQRVEKVTTGKHSETEIDAEDFSRRIEKTCNDMHDKGYDLVSMNEVIRGAYHYDAKPNQSRTDHLCAGGGYSIAYGYSMTDGMMILFRKRG
ncbi:hypothetical protein GCM10007301_42090 [Azorhizobium oxalatiphilum]|uniref:Uncharacterized protein n=1 Tax=Azorhizobium oxalatiphilum TaxID=980631 RepID=A0A917C9N3_9HYPH|nr:hypothetical protein [Azorhizobium oxalatiphilum]GGF77737.1 hypothetical protein GCM10007301_42090 [Azorhizobium oxalatiphilum]